MRNTSLEESNICKYKDGRSINTSHTLFVAENLERYAHNVPKTLCPIRTNPKVTTETR